MRQGLCHSLGPLRLHLLHTRNGVIWISNYPNIGRGTGINVRYTITESLKVWTEITQVTRIVERQF